MPKVPAPPRVSLKEFVEKTARELSEIKPIGRAVIKLTECEMQVQAELTAEGSGGLSVWIISAGAKATVGSTTKVTLKFQPVDEIQAFGKVGAAPHAS